MNGQETATSEAAELVLRERARQREHNARQTNADALAAVPPKLETVSVPRWDGAEAGDVDESELDRRQRALSQHLDKRQAEVVRQGKELARVRRELKKLEEPIKLEIMALRERLEESNRREMGLVTTVNTLRKDLFEKEGELGEVRKEKQAFADQLITVMADYEKRKTDRLNEIVDLVGGEPVGEQKTASRASDFVGF